jgi:predicted nucleic acid-binding Zn finger protein
VKSSKSKIGNEGSSYLVTGNFCSEIRFLLLVGEKGKSIMHRMRNVQKLIAAGA